VEALESMAQHRPVDLLQDASAYLDHEVRSNPDDVLVERCVMQLAQRYPIRDNWFTTAGIGQYVCCVQQLCMPQSADAAHAPVRLDDSLTEACLMQTMPSQTRDVGTSAAYLSRFRRGNAEGMGVVQRDLERQAPGIVAHDVDRPRSEVLTWNETVEVDERRVSLHRAPKTAILVMVWIVAPVTVDQMLVRADRVIVWTMGSGRDAQRHVSHHGRLEDALGTNEWDATTFVGKPCCEQPPRQDLTMDRDGLFEKGERGEADRAVWICH
jgi:hypothetical protein